MLHSSRQNLTSKNRVSLKDLGLVQSSLLATQCVYHCLWALWQLIEYIQVLPHILEAVVVNRCVMRVTGYLLRFCAIFVHRFDRVFIILVVRLTIIILVVRLF